MSSWLPTLLPAIFGLAGVLLGSGLSTVKDWWFARGVDVRNARYLAVRVVGLLDRYVFACSEVVSDNGLDRGQRDQNSYLAAQMAPPKFMPEVLEVEWRSIPVELMYDILDLPYKTEVANHIIEGASENADPPDFDDFFEERQLQFANLGLQAAAIASRLRTHAKLPERSIAHWDPVGWLVAKRSEVEETRARRAEAWSQKSDA